MQQRTAKQAKIADTLGEVDVGPEFPGVVALLCGSLLLFKCISCSADTAGSCAEIVTCHFLAFISLYLASQKWAAERLLVLSCPSRSFTGCPPIFLFRAQDSAGSNRG